MQNRFKPTGVTYPTELVSSGHKKGVLCLACGIYVGNLICENCHKFKKCELCGIVCKEQPTNKIYMYGRASYDRKVSVELFQEVNTICQVLNDGLCEDCVMWEHRIKGVCICCGERFETDYKHYKEMGNCCSPCNQKVIDRVKSKITYPNLQRFKKKKLSTVEL